MPRTQANDGTRPFEEFDGETYGEAHGFDDLDGEFRTRSGGGVRLMSGPPMVAEQLVRTLRTPVGSDPLRPEFGLDRDEFLGGSELRSKEAIIEAIGPDADPRVAALSPQDIEIVEPAGANREVEFLITATLADGTPVEFRGDWRALLFGE